jgi:hypothetical protein
MSHDAASNRRVVRSSRHNEMIDKAEVFHTKIIRIISQHSCNVAIRKLLLTHVSINNFECTLHLLKSTLKSPPSINDPETDQQ